MPKIDIDTYLKDEFSAIPVKRYKKKTSRLSQREKQIQFLMDLNERGDKAPAELSARFTPSFQPSEHERFWLINYLEEFYENQIITDILWKVKGGKEANVYCCAAHPSTGYERIAAKVYRPSMFRNLRNDSRYRQGREVVDEDGKVSHGRREALAMRKNTRFGQELRHTAWLESEYQTLQMLSEAGADVPKPLGRNDNVILMEYVGGAGNPAPILQQVRLPAARAGALFERMIENLEIMLACHRVHADLSAYNVLFWEGRFKIIDFPQAVDPRRNSDAADLFARDVERLCQYFARYRLGKDPRALADELWGRFLSVNVSAFTQ